MYYVYVPFCAEAGIIGDDDDHRNIPSYDLEMN